MGIHDDNLEKSAKSFREVIAPILIEWLGGEIESGEEDIQSPTIEKLDRDAGIDQWKFGGEDATIGIASRIQWGPSIISKYDQPHNTFTVRSLRSSSEETEFQKRKQQIHSPSNYSPFPYFTVQAYLTEPSGDLVSMALVDTEKLIRFCEDHLEGERAPYDAGGYGVRKAPEPMIPGRWSEFYYVKWWYLEKNTTFGPRTWPENDDFWDQRAFENVLNSTLDDYKSASVKLCRCGEQVTASADWCPSCGRIFDEGHGGARS